MSAFQIRFVTDHDFVSWAIRKVTFSEFSHVELVTDEGTYIGAHARGGIKERVDDPDDLPTFERRYSLPCTQAQKDKIFAYARSKIGTKYNFRDIFGLLIHSNFSSPNRLICSMFVFEAALAGGIQMLNVLPRYSNLVTPDTLHLSPLLIGRCVYQTAKPE